jgi:hypothetical protein
MPNNNTFLCRARTNALYCSIHELVVELEERIEDGEPFDNPKLTRTADRIFGGTRAEGRYTSREAYDALEIAVNNYLLEKHAHELMQMDVCDALSSVLRPLLQRLPTQTDRTLEQTELQQFSTPPTLAYFVARLLDSKPGDIVLEPSAGTGSLAIWPHAIGARVICNETSVRRNSLLR